ncbi:hypothetical protein [Bradyrhizobium sp. JR3.5]
MAFEDHPRIVASVKKSGREEFRITIRNFNGNAKLEIRVFENRPDTGWSSTPRHLVVGRDHGAVKGLIDSLALGQALLEAEAAA